MAILVDWVKQTVSGTPGTGAITLGNASSGFIRFQDDTRISNGSVVYYTIEDGANRERGIGTYSTTGPTLTRTAIHAKIESGTYSENPGTGLSLTSAAIVSCSAIAATHNFMGASVYHSTTQSVNNATSVACEFNSELYDIGGFHDNATNNSRFTIPTGVTMVRLSGCARFAASLAGTRLAWFQKNGVASAVGDGLPVSYFDVDSAITHAIPISPVVVQCTAGDYFELMVYQTTGGALNVGGLSGHQFSIEAVQ